MWFTVTFTDYAEKVNSFFFSGLSDVKEAFASSSDDWICLTVLVSGLLLTAVMIELILHLLLVLLCLLLLCSYFYPPWN